MWKLMYDDAQNAEELDLGTGTRVSTSTAARSPEANHTAFSPQVHITVDKTIEYTADIPDNASSERLSTDQKGVGMSLS